VYGVIKNNNNNNNTGFGDQCARIGVLPDVRLEMTDERGVVGKRLLDGRDHTQPDNGEQKQRVGDLQGHQQQWRRRLRTVPESTDSKRWRKSNKNVNNV